jgi:hypothetical protein
MTRGETRTRQGIIPTEATTEDGITASVGMIGAGVAGIARTGETRTATIDSDQSYKSLRLRLRGERSKTLAAFYFA